MRGNHTTFIDLAAKVVDVIHPLPSVKGISAGFIRNGQGVAGGVRKVKISKWEGGLLLNIHQSNSAQELRLYVTDSQEAMLSVARTLRDNNLSICFKH